MSIALNINKIAQEELQKAKGHKIIAIDLAVGKLSGVVIESLSFALEASRKEGPLSSAEITINELPANMKCLKCNHEFEAEEFYTICPKCSEFRHEIISGKELTISSLTIE